MTTTFHHLHVTLCCEWPNRVADLLHLAEPLVELNV